VGRQRHGDNTRGAGGGSRRVSARLRRT
jgi:hypothetical protein